MNPLETLFHEAARRRDEKHLPYAGALTPAEAYSLLQLDDKAVLIDVRTRAELDWVGRPTLSEAQYGHIEWTRYPGGLPNPDFLDQLRARAGTATPLLFLCRSAVRSKAAATAAAQAGFTRCLDVLEGFEGDRDAQGHRKTVGGWCLRGLPWTGA